MGGGIYLLLLYRILVIDLVEDRFEPEIVTHIGGTCAEISYIPNKHKLIVTICDTDHVVYVWDF